MEKEMPGPLINVLGLCNIFAESRPGRISVK